MFLRIIFLSLWVTTSSAIKINFDEQVSEQQVPVTLPDGKALNIIGEGSFGTVVTGTVETSESTHLDVAIKIFEDKGFGHWAREVAFHSYISQNTSGESKLVQYVAAQPIKVVATDSEVTGSLRTQVRKLPLEKRYALVSELIGKENPMTMRHGMRYFISNVREMDEEKRYQQQSGAYFLLLSFIKDVFEGLSEMHSSKLCHFDIRPENIMVDRRGLHIGDFGTTCVQSETAADESFVEAFKKNLKNEIGSDAHKFFTEDIIKHLLTNLWRDKGYLCDSRSTTYAYSELFMYAYNGVHLPSKEKSYEKHRLHTTRRKAYEKMIQEPGKCTRVDLYGAAQVFLELLIGQFHAFTPRQDLREKFRDEVYKLVEEETSLAHHEQLPQIATKVLKDFLDGLDRDIYPCTLWDSMTPLQKEDIASILVSFLIAEIPGVKMKMLASTADDIVRITNEKLSILNSQKMSILNSQKNQRKKRKRTVAKRRERKKEVVPEYSDAYVVDLISNVLEMISSEEASEFPPQKRANK